MIASRRLAHRLLAIWSYPSISSISKKLPLPTGTANSLPQILPLNQLLRNRSEEDPTVLFETRPEESFEYGMEPLEFRLQLHVYFKYAHWLSNPTATQRLNQFVQDYSRH